MWAATWQNQQSDCPHEESLGPYLPIKRIAKTLIRLGGCPGWPESSLGTQSLCWFRHVAAHVNLEQYRHSGSMPIQIFINVYPFVQKILWKNTFLHQSRAITLLFINEFSPFAIPNHSSLTSMSMQSLKKISQKLLKLDSGNEALTDGRTDTQTVRRV